MTVAELGRRMSSLELEEWKAEDRIRAAERSAPGRPSGRDPDG